VGGGFDFIFCRNVMIYFDRETQKRIVDGFAELLPPGGYLFLGHSESLQGQMEVFEPLRGTIYRARGAAAAATEAAAVSPHESGAAPTGPAAVAPPPNLSIVPSVAQAPARSARRRAAHAQEQAISRTSVVRPTANGPTVPRIHVTIGGVRASAEPIQLRTVLGSCVCACLYDPAARLGGINHFMLPDGLDDGDLPTRYGVNAMEMLINEIAKLGGDRRRLQAKAFGAAHVLVKAGLSPEVPRKNARFIKEFLEAEGIPLVSQRLGGSAPVEVLFHTADGRALVRALGANIADTLVREETHFDLEVRRQLMKPPDDAVVLFGEAA
jgi:chemotaxis receptor (MCP) glutamine deamidase CheD